MKKFALSALAVQLAFTCAVAVAEPSATTNITTHDTPVQAMSHSTGTAQTAEADWASRSQSVSVTATGVAPTAGKSFVHQNLSRAKFTNEYLPWANFRGAILTESGFRGANLINANFSGATALGADLRWAKLQGADFSDADFSNARTYGAMFQDAKYNKNTRFPATFIPQNHGMIKVD